MNRFWQLLGLVAWAALGVASILFIVILAVSADLLRLKFMLWLLGENYG